MKLLEKKIPRGVIYHRLAESVRYLIGSAIAPVENASRISQFEETFAGYCERQYCVAFPFARTAIYFVLKSLDLPKGTEVILPPITIKGIVDVVVDLGLVPLYVDLDPETVSFQLDDLATKLNSKVKAAIITPLFGLVPNMTAMVRLLREHGVYIIEDFSQCLNGRFDGKRIGTFGDVGIYSASSIKTLDTLGGGMAITDDPQLAESLRQAQKSLFPPSRKFLVKKAWINLVRNFATSGYLFSMFTFPLLQIIRKRNPELALKQTGHRDKAPLSKLPHIWFCGYTSIQAEIGLSLIKRVKGEDQSRVANAELIKTRCGTDKFPVTTAKSSNVYWQLILLVSDAVKAQSDFAERGVDTATSSLELVSALPNYPGRAKLPSAEKIYANGIFIPCFPSLSEGDLERVVVATCGLF